MNYNDNVEILLIDIFLEISYFKYIHIKRFCSQIEKKSTRYYLQSDLIYVLFIIIFTKNYDIIYYK